MGSDTTDRVFPLLRSSPHSPWTKRRPQFRTSSCGIGVALVFCALLQAASAAAAAVGSADRCPPENDILPCRCRIRAQEMQIWCSHSELERVRRALEGVMVFLSSTVASGGSPASSSSTPVIEEVVLEQNKMTGLPGRALGGLQVRRLLLRHNGLQTVSRNAFAGLEGSLRELFVEEELLEDLPWDTLDYLRRLEAFTLLGASGLRRIPRLAGLPRLKYVRVEDCGALQLEPAALHSLPALRFFQLTGCEITRLEAGVIDGLGPALAVANLSSNLISHLHPRAFAGLPDLQELDLSGNRIRDAAMLGRAIRAAPGLRILNAARNPLERLQEGALGGMRSLATLDLRDCDLREVRPEAFSQLPALRRLDLSRNSLTRLPAGAFSVVPQLEELFLAGNQLGSDLGGLLAALPQLRSLDLSANRLQELPAAALGRGHHLLERLSLEHNGLRWIQPQALLGFPALTELRLRNNTLSSLPPTGDLHVGGLAPAESGWWHLPALKGLDLADNHLTRLDDGLLAQLPALRHVDLSGNRILQLASQAFRACPLLEHVNVSGNELAAIPVDAFRGLQHLYELDLARNKLAHLPDTLFRDLASLELLSLAFNRLQAIPSPASFATDGLSGVVGGGGSALQELDLRGNAIGAMPVGALSPLRQLRTLRLGANLIGSLARGCLRGLVRLENLHLASNRIHLVEDGALSDAARLQTLDLQHNRMQSVGPDTFSGLAELRRLDIQHNRIATVSPDAFRDTVQLQELSLSHNQLTEFPPALLDVQSLQVLHAGSNQLQTLGDTPFRRLPRLTQLFLNDNRLGSMPSSEANIREGLFQDMPSLNILDLHGNELQELGPRSFVSLPNLRFLRLSSNRVNRVQNNALRDLPALQGLELQSNGLRVVGEGAFQGLTSLRYLNLSHNDLDSVSRAGLQALPSLEMLDLSHNRILEVDDRALRHLHWLVNLRMDNNYLCRIHPHTFDTMSRLRMLSLRNNQLARINEDTFYKLKDNVALLDISGNPLQCDCDMAWLRQWLEDNVVKEESAARCFEPPEMLGVPLRELRASRMTCAYHRSLSNNVDTCSPSALQAAASASTLLSATPGNRGRGPRPNSRPPRPPSAGMENAGSSQVLSAWMNVRHNSSDSGNTGPHQSDYFDDEYVEYQYDDSSVSNSSSPGSETNQVDNSLIPPGSEVVIIDPDQVLSNIVNSTSDKSGAAKQAGPVSQLSPDVVPGDTPTIYAGSSSVSRPSINKGNSSSKVGSGPSGFSLFGIPLPSLDLGLTLGLAPTLSLVSKGLQGAAAVASLGAVDKAHPHEDVLHRPGGHPHVHPHVHPHLHLNDAQPAGSGVPAYTPPDHPYIPLAPPPPPPIRTQSGFIPMDPLTPAVDVPYMVVTPSTQETPDYYEDYSHSQHSVASSPSPSRPTGTSTLEPDFSLSELWGMLTGDKATAATSTLSGSPVLPTSATIPTSSQPPTPPTFTTTLRAGLGFHHGDTLPRRPPGRPTITKVEIGASSAPGQLAPSTALPQPSSFQPSLSPAAFPSSSPPPPTAPPRPSELSAPASSLPHVFHPPEPEETQVNIVPMAHHPQPASQPDSLDWYYNNYHNDNQDPYIGPNPSSPSSASLYFPSLFLIPIAISVVLS